MDNSVSFIHEDAMIEITELKEKKLEAALPPNEILTSKISREAISL